MGKNVKKWSKERGFMKKVFILSMALVTAGIVFAGCSSQTSRDTSRPVSEIATEAKALDVIKLKQIITQYQGLIEAKKNDIVGLQSKIKEIPMAQLLGENAQKLKNEISDVSTSLNALVERLNVYMKELKVKGGTL